MIRALYCPLCSSPVNIHLQPRMRVFQIRGRDKLVRVDKRYMLEDPEISFTCSQNEGHPIIMDEHRLHEIKSYLMINY